MRFGNVLAGAALCAIIQGVLAASLPSPTGCSTVTLVLTTTVTASAFNSSSAAAAPDPTMAPASFDPQVSNIASLPSPFSTISFMSALTSYSTLISYITLHSQTTIVVPDPAASSATAYYYAYLNGTTSWLNGVALPSTYDAYITKTIQFTVYPVAANTGEDMTIVQTQSSPPLTVALDPTLNQASVPTSTSTVTSYLTHLITSVTTLTMTSSRSEVGAARGPGPSGWNSSSDQVPYPTFLSGGTITGPPVTITQSLEYASPHSRANFSALQLASVVTFPLSATGTAALGLSTINLYTLSATAVDPGESTQSGVTQNPAHFTSMSNSTYLVSAAALTAFSTKLPGTLTAVAPLASSGPNQTTSLAFISAQYSYEPLVTAGEGSIVAATASVTPIQTVPTLNSTGEIPVGTLSKAGVLAISSNLSSETTSAGTLIPGSQVSSTVDARSIPTPSVCGEHGDFMLTWDDEPDFSPTKPIDDPSLAAPVFGPYHHLYFSTGYVYLPEPNVSYSPASAPHLAMYLTNDTGPSSIPGAGGEHAGEIGAGDRASESAFWFNAYSAYMGCDNEGPDECVVQISGYVHQGGEEEVLAIQHQVSIAACPQSSGCKLQQVSFPKSMVGLSGVQFQAFVGGEQRSWFMDNLALGWYNKTCAAGLLRSRSQ